MNRTVLKWILIGVLFTALIAPVNAICDGEWGTKITTHENIYIYGNNQRIAMKTTQNPKEVYYFHSDNLGSTSVMSNSKGKKIAEENYSVFGEVLSSNGENPTDFFFTGKELDEGTGLYYYGARYYDPETGRFISADSFSGRATKPQTQNKYTYTSNNPLKYVDPTGNDEAPASYFFGPTAGDLLTPTQINKVNGGSFTVSPEAKQTMFALQVTATTVGTGASLADTESWEMLDIWPFNHMHRGLASAQEWTVTNLYMMGMTEEAAATNLTFGLVRGVLSPIGLASMGLLSAEATAEARAAQIARTAAARQASRNYALGNYWWKQYNKTWIPEYRYWAIQHLREGLSANEYRASITVKGFNYEEYAVEQLGKYAVEKGVKMTENWWWAEENPWLVPANP